MLIYFCRLMLEKTNVEEELKHQKALYEQLEQQHNLVLTERKWRSSPDHGSIFVFGQIKLFSLNPSRGNTLFHPIRIQNKIVCT